LTAELLPAFVAPKPRVKQPDQAYNQSLSKPAASKNSKFADCVKKEIDKEVSPEVKANETAKSRPGLFNNQPSQQESPDEIEAGMQEMKPEAEADTAAELSIPTMPQAQDIPTLEVSITEAVLYKNENASNTVTPQATAMPETNSQPVDKLLTGPTQPLNPEQLNINGAELPGKELIDAKNASIQSEQISAETKSTAGIQVEGQNNQREMQSNSLSNVIQKEPLPVQLLVDERPANQDKQLMDKQVDVKQLIQMENNRNLSQRVVPATPQSQISAQGEGSGRQQETDITNLPGQVTAESNLTSRGSSLENTNLSTVTAKPDATDVIDQIVKKATMMLKANTSEMRIELKPEFLGKMLIKIVVEDGLVTARFVTENQQVKNLLENNLAALRQSLEAQGIRVERTEVNIGLNNGGLFDGSEGNREWMWNHSGEQYRREENYTDAAFVNEAAELEEQLAEISHIGTYQFHENGTMDFVI